MQLFLRRGLVSHRLKLCAAVWPIDEKASKPPDKWCGWPQNKRFALVLTHDVETEKGQQRCNDLMKLDESLDFRSSFNFVPERYNVSPELRHRLTNSGFEVGVHGLNHDGKLYRSREFFRTRADRINMYLKKWNAVGFRSPAMHHNLEWIHDLDIEYDASTFDTDPFEPQPSGVGTVFPFWVCANGARMTYLELPYTLPQDFTLFVLMKEKSIDIWKKKLDWIAEKGAMALLITHPDYMNVCKTRCDVEEYPSRYYVDFLEYVRHKYDGQYWNVLPKELVQFWKQNCPSE